MAWSEYTAAKLHGTHRTRLWTAGFGETDPGHARPNGTTRREMRIGTKIRGLRAWPHLLDGGTGPPREDGREEHSMAEIPTHLPWRKMDEHRTCDVSIEKSNRRRKK